MTLRIAVAGIGNCASALIQGLGHYASKGTGTTGLIFPRIGRWSPSDIEVVAAFDIDRRKVGRSLTEAVYARPNCAKAIHPPPGWGDRLNVMMGMPMDGLPAHMEDYSEDEGFRLAEAEPVDVSRVLVETGAQVLVSYMPVGAEQATKYYAECCLESGVAMVNCSPVFIASSPDWGARFAARKLPIIGDDIKSQFGATIVHRVLTRLAEDRGISIDNTYQLNVGGNTDFLNMLSRERLTSKKISKTMAIQSEMATPLSPDQIHIGPSDYISWLKDNKVCFLRIEGRGFADVPLELELRLSVQDSPNSAAVVVDAIRCAAMAREQGLAGPLEAPSAFMMKSPPRQHSDGEALRLMEAFVQGNQDRD